MNNEKFWIVWKRGSTVNEFRQHISLESAKNEAERLANLSHGEYFVFEAMSVSTRPPAVLTTKLVHVPF